MKPQRTRRERPPSSRLQRVFGQVLVALTGSGHDLGPHGSLSANFEFGR